MPSITRAVAPHNPSWQASAGDGGLSAIRRASMHVRITDSGRLATRRSMEVSVTPRTANQAARASSEMPT
eukprot:6771358-Heterocapsa_arctica.AAC.1